MTSDESAVREVAAAGPWTVDDLARKAGLPVRTIREYQTLGLLPPPRRRGRIGLYGSHHLARLQLIGRLQERGYSLAGIGDLLESWTNGDDLAEVLGLQPDQLVHIDEPGIATELGQLTRVLPGLVPNRLEELLAIGILDRCGADQFCVPSPSLLQLASDALSLGLSPDRVLGLLKVIGAAASAIGDEVAGLVAELPAVATPDQLAAMAARGRGLLGHGVGRLTIYSLGRRLQTEDHDGAKIALRSFGALHR